MYAEIAVNAPVDNTYDYQVPPELEGKLQAGHRVGCRLATPRKPAPEQSWGGVETFYACAGRINWK